MFNLSALTKGELYALRLEVNNYIEQFEKAALNSLNLGIPVKDYALKKGRNSRKLDNEQATAADLIKEGVTFNDLYISKLKGIPDLEKVAIKYNCEASLVKHIKVTEGKPSLIFTGSIPATKE